MRWGQIQERGPQKWKHYSGALSGDFLGFQVIASSGGSVSKYGVESLQSIGVILSEWDQIIFWQLQTPYAFLDLILCQKTRNQSNHQIHSLRSMVFASFSKQTKW